MKKLFILLALPLFFTGCFSESGNTKDKSFNQYMKELEKEEAAGNLDPGDPNLPTVMQSEVDRLREIEMKAQKERRADVPLVESDYIFKVMPDKGTYFYDEYNQVATDDPKLKDYADTKRLWKKPQRFKPETYGTEEVADDGSGAAATDGANLPEDYAEYE